MCTPSLTEPFIVGPYSVRLAPVKKKGGPREGQYRIYITDTRCDKGSQTRLYSPTLVSAVDLLANYVQRDACLLHDDFVKSGLMKEESLSTTKETMTKQIETNVNTHKTTNDMESNVTKATVQVQPTLSEEQLTIIKAALSGESVFFTGSAGTGKSFVLRMLVKALKKKYSVPHSVFVTAPTGIAACNVGGITLHSFAGVGLGKGSAHFLAESILKHDVKAANWQQCKVLVIDEVSMLDGHFMDKLDVIGRRVRDEPDLPFGGIQLILCGDFYQLPPVHVDNGACFAFESKVWKSAVTQSFELSQVYRQQDPVFVKCLNELRRGTLSEETTRVLLATSSNPLTETNSERTIIPTTLYSHNVDVDHENHARLEELSGACITYKARDTVSNKAMQRMMDKMPAPDSLQLKIGAQVILTKNIAFDMGLANGTRGVVIDFQVIPIDNPYIVKSKLAACNTDTAYRVDSPYCKMPVIQFLLPHGKTLKKRIGPEKWTVEDGSKVIGERMQLPLRLAWALSIHKSQGMTIGLLETNVGRCFDYGQCYVALSRAVSLEHLCVKDFDTKRVRVHPKVAKFHSTISSASLEANDANQ